MTHYRIECTGKSREGHKVRQLAILRDPARDAREEARALAVLEDLGFDRPEVPDRTGAKLDHMLEEKKHNRLTGRTRTIDRARGVARLETAEGSLWAFRCPSCSSPWFVPEQRLREAFDEADANEVNLLNVADLFTSSR